MCVSCLNSVLLEKTSNNMIHWRDKKAICLHYSLQVILFIFITNTFVSSVFTDVLEKGQKCNSKDMNGPLFFEVVIYRKTHQGCVPELIRRGKTNDLFSQWSTSDENEA